MKSFKSAAEDAESTEKTPQKEEKGMLGEDAFHQMIYLERKRSERSGKPFLLLQIHIETPSLHGEKTRIFNTVNRILSVTLRETDVLGWLEQDAVFGVICTEIGEADVNRACNRIHEKIHGSLGEELSSPEMASLDISFIADWGEREKPMGEYPVKAQPLHDALHVK